MMKTLINDVRIYNAVSTLSRPIADATHDISKISFYVLEIQLESGITGQGYLLSFHYSPNAIEGALRDKIRFSGAGTYERREEDGYGALLRGGAPGVGGRAGAQ